MLHGSIGKGVTLALLLSAVSADGPGHARATEPGGAADATKHLGGLSEEQFKALHALPAAGAPAPKGTMIDVAGSRAYLSLPEGAKPPLPGVVVIQEWWGLNDHIKHWADRLAADGYAALAVDLYGGRVATTRDSAMAYMQSVDEARAREILLAAHALLASDPRIAATRRGCIGWCFGGAWSLRLAMAAPDLDAAVIYYGHLESDPEKLAAIRAPVFGVFGNKDPSIPPAAVDAFAAGLEKAGVEHQILRYDAEHAFANPSNARYDQKSAADAWRQVRAFLRKELKGS
jgi:carboxymethylenebutenolidase